MSVSTERNATPSGGTSHPSIIYIDARNGFLPFYFKIFYLKGEIGWGNNRRANLDAGQRLITGSKLASCFSNQNASRKNWLPVDGAFVQTNQPPATPIELVTMLQVIGG